MSCGEKNTRSRFRSAALWCALVEGLASTGCRGMSPDDDLELGETQQGVAQLAASHITWGTIGLDSNNVNVGPNVFPVGVRIRNIGDATATGVTAVFTF